jgi:isopenicillin-N N-acyltransferase-like protein
MAVDSLYRVPLVRRGLQDVRSAPNTALTRDAIATALSNDDFGPNAVCAMPDPLLPAVKQWQTVAATVVDLTTGEYLVADGLPRDRPFNPLPWNLYDKQAGRSSQSA